MSFSEFFQQNILLFGALVAVFATLMVLEYRGLLTRGANLTTSGLSQQVNAGAKLIDLRRQDDFRAGHIAGAKNFPFESAKDNPQTLGDKDEALVLYCYTGTSSATMVGKLRKLGYSNVSHLRGGMNAWLTDSLPVTKKA